MTEAPNPSQPPKKPFPVWAVFALLVAAAVTAIVLAGTQGPASNTNNTPAGNTNSAANSNTTGNSNANGSGGTEPNQKETKTYTNTAYAYAIEVPISWGRISEFDGSFSSDLTVGSTPTTNYLVFGTYSGRNANTGLDQTTPLLLATVARNKTFSQQIREESGVAAQENYTTRGASALVGFHVTFKAGSHQYTEAYYFEHRGALYEFDVVDLSPTTVATVDSLTFL